MKFKISITAIIFIQVIFQSSVAQNIDFKFNLVSGTNGISLGKINAITQDKWGYMWFVDQTNKCLIRFDGYRMKTYRNDPLDSNSIDGVNFECIATDSTGAIWVDAARGVDKFDPYTGKFIHFRYPRTKASRKDIYNILIDHLGTVWLGTNTGLDQLDQKTGKFIHYENKDNDPSSLSCDIVRSLYEDHQGVLWIGTGQPWVPMKGGGLNRFNRKTGTFTRYMHDPVNPHSLINDKIRAIFEDSKGIFWVGTQDDGLHIMDRNTGSFTRLTYDPNHPEKLSRPPVNKANGMDHITFITEDMTGAIWIGTFAAGIIRYDPVTKKITRKQSENGYPDSTCWTSFLSHDGVLWVSTEKSRLLYRVDPFNRSINSISTGNVARSFLEDKKGYLWVATRDNGLLKYDQQKKLIKQFKNDPLNPFSLNVNRVNSLFQSQEDTIWVGTGTGVRIFNNVTQQFSMIPDSLNLKDAVGNGIIPIIQDKQGFMWFGRWAGGLVAYNPIDHSFKHFYSNANDSTSIGTNTLLSILEDRSGVLWIGGIGGEAINRLNRETGSFKHYMSGRAINDLFEDSGGSLWAGTDDGLYRYNQKEDRFTNFFDQSDKINSFIVQGIIEDNSKAIWLKSESAIIKLNPITKEIFIYGSRFGIKPNSMMFPGGMYKNKQGQLYIGHENGFFTFLPEELTVKTDLKIIITDLFINTLLVLPGKGNILQKPIEEISDLELKYNQNNIDFNFAAIDYREPETTKYFTMLENYDNTWRKAIGEKTSYYSNVSPGNYVYRVKANNSDGTKVEKSITIHIDPPWWQTWWAYTLYAIMLIFSIWAIISWRTKALQKEKVILEKKVATRTTELKKEKEIVESTLSELKSTQAQLIQSEKMASLGELTAGIAHEIQNPLNFVNNFSELSTELVDEMNEQMDKGNTEDAKLIAQDLKQNLEKINHHGKRAGEIVKGMLEHSRTSTGVKEPTDINALADEYLRLSYHGFRAKDRLFTATMKTDFDETIGNINIIPQDIGRVLLNLYNNAFYAVSLKQKTESKEYEPAVSISTKKVGERIEIKVADNGNGIPKKIVDKIFQPFFTTKPTGQGTGLGLSLSYDIIKVHNGEIKVESKEDEGTNIYIELPI